MKTRRASAAFTLIELLTVISILALLAALVAPVVVNFRKGDAMLAATRQMLDAVHRGRQLAISQHTTVYMVFVPPTLSADTAYGTLTGAGTPLTPAEKTAALNVLERQQVGYTYVSLRSAGDQPGRGTPRYLTSWQSLPESSFIPSWKFIPSAPPVRTITDANTLRSFDVAGFDYVNFIPFPSEDAAYHTPPVLAYPSLPYIAFDYLGRLATAGGQPLGHDEYIPLAHGSVAPARDPATKRPTLFPPTEMETPVGNSTNSAFNLIHIDWLTGRARLERQEVR